MNEYNPDYPKTIAEAKAMLQRMHDEDETDTNFMHGYRMALRIGINQLNVLEKHYKQAKLNK